MRIILFILLSTATAFAEDLEGYVLRHDYQGTDYYWVHDGAFRPGTDQYGSWAVPVPGNCTASGPLGDSSNRE